MLEGLTQVEAERRLASEGLNELPRPRNSLATQLWEVIREPMFVLLLGAGGLYALIGDLGEALLLLLFATFSVTIAVVQRGRSDRVLDELRDLTSPRALVVRDGLHKRIGGQDVVCGDLLVLSEGDRIAADAVLVAGTDVRVAEAMLTGESMPVLKEPCSGAPEGSPAPNDSSMLYGGTLLVAGSGLARVVATGPRSQIGLLGACVRDIEPEVPKLQAQTRRLVLGFGIVGGVLSALAVLLYGFVRGNWVEALLGGIALGMSMLPEEFPLVLTVFMVMGAWRLSHSRVLTRRATAIETLGAATVLCTDKTGTLTQNSMAVVRLEADVESWRAEEGRAVIARSRALSQLLEAAMLACEPQGTDPMDGAVATLASDSSLVIDPTGHTRTYPLRRELLAVTHVWDESGVGSLRIAAKGAPEAISRLCHMSAAEQEAMIQRVDVLARQGIRVLAVARGTWPRGPLPADVSELPLRLTGLVGFADPLRDEVPAAVMECRNAGVRVVMITGDYPHTAQAIARQAGLEQGLCLTGEEVESLSNGELASRVRDVSVFARIAPQQKLRIVNAFKENGETVAMTGDGVNDAAALKSAHIGIAMGGRGTDVAREAASLVLLDDDFGSIVRAIRLGRRIYDNLRKAMGYIMAIHVPIAGLALLPLLSGAPLILTPMLIALLELIIDPTCSIVLEAEHAEADVMKRPPRDSRTSLIPGTLAAWSILHGLLALVVVSAVYWHALDRGLSSQQVRLSAFVTLIAASIALLLSSRRSGASLRAAFGSENTSLWWVLAATVALLVIMISWPMTRTFFGVAVPDAGEVVLALAAGVGLFALLQLTKVIRNR